MTNRRVPLREMTSPYDVGPDTRMNPNAVRLGIFRIADKANPADELGGPAGRACNPLLSSVCATAGPGRASAASLRLCRWREWLLLFACCPPPRTRRIRAGPCSRAPAREKARRNRRDQHGRVVAEEGGEGWPAAICRQMPQLEAPGRRHQQRRGDVQRAVKTRRAEDDLAWPLLRIADEFLQRVPWLLVTDDQYAGIGNK